MVERGYRSARRQSKSGCDKPGFLLVSLKLRSDHLKLRWEVRAVAVIMKIVIPGAVDAN